MVKYITQTGNSSYRFLCKECRNRSYDGYKAEYRKRPDYKQKTDTYNKNSRLNKLSKKYNLTKDEYLFLLKRQDSCCAICHAHESKLSKSLSVDHNHITGQVRGLLCTNCNTALGLLKENIDLYKRSIQYIELHK